MATINPVASNFFSPQLTRPSPVRRDSDSAIARHPSPTPDINDVVDLSPLAQILLAGFTGIGSNDNNPFDTSSDLFGFYLTEAQQKKIAEILARHKGEPLNQETFDAIMDDLAEEGLSPEQLAVENSLRFFDPFASLLGVAGTVPRDTNNTTEAFLNNSLNLPVIGNNIPGQQANMNAYVLQIITQFLAISVT